MKLVELKSLCFSHAWVVMEEVTTLTDGQP